MRILITYYSIPRWEEESISRALQQLGAAPAMVDVSREPLEIGSRIEGVSIALQRSVSRTAALETSAALESLGLRVVNTSTSTAVAQSKVWSLSRLSAAGLRIPRSFAAAGSEAVLRAAQMLGLPGVYKPSQGSWGRLISLARSPEELGAIARHREAIGPHALAGVLQELVRKPGRDIRATVVGDEVVSIYRVNRSHWVTNTARGARAEPAPKDPELEDTAIRASRALGLEIAGIDIFEDPERGYLVNEANPVPEFKNVARVTGVDVGLLVASYLVEEARR